MSWRSTLRMCCASRIGCMSVGELMHPFYLQESSCALNINRTFSRPRSRLAASVDMQDQSQPECVTLGRLPVKLLAVGQLRVGHRYTVCLAPRSADFYDER